MNHAAFCYGRKLEAKQGSFSPDLAMDLALHVASVCLMSRVQTGLNFTHCQHTITTTNSNIGSEIDGVQAWNSSNYDK